MPRAQLMGPEGGNPEKDRNNILFINSQTDKCHDYVGSLLHRDSGCTESSGKGGTDGGKTGLNGLGGAS